VDKRLTAEEERILEVLGQRRPDTEIHRHMVALWPDYVNGIKRACDEDSIPFIDLNQVELEGWCFVDAVHMTRNGEMQIARHLARAIAGDS
jgi:hypothetical protein